MSPNTFPPTPRGLRHWTPEAVMDSFALMRPRRLFNFEFPEPIYSCQIAAQERDHYLNPLPAVVHISSWSSPRCSRLKSILQHVFSSPWVALRTNQEQPQTDSNAFQFLAWITCAFFLVAPTV